MSRLAGEQIRDQAVLHWVADRGDATLSIVHDRLDENSLVIDMGGYKGEWAQKIFDRYGCSIEIYEPAHEFVLEIERRFHKELGNKITVKECALGSQNASADLVMDGLATSIKKNDHGGATSIVAVSSVLANRKIDLLKMNIEGSEYEVFESLFENNMIKNIDSIFVQFHPIDDESIKRYNSIADRLASTHECVFRYPFIWEKWSVKESNK
jgi:FkbM family methyltransferase